MVQNLIRFKANISLYTCLLELNIIPVIYKYIAEQHNFSMN